MWTEGSTYLLLRLSSIYPKRGASAAPDVTPMCAKPSLPLWRLIWRRTSVSMATLERTAPSTGLPKDTRDHPDQTSLSSSIRPDDFPTTGRWLCPSRSSTTSGLSSIDSRSKKLIVSFVQNCQNFDKVEEVLEALVWKLGSSGAS
jgi:hypothetical protein